MKLIDLSSLLCGSGFPALSGNIYCIGRNYREHAKEMQAPIPTEPVVFLKAPSAIRPLNSPDLAFPEESFHYEAELIMLVGEDIKQGGKASQASIAGLSLGLDLTRREIQAKLKKEGLPWTIAKSFAGSAIIHPFCKALAELDRIHFAFELNSQPKQRGNSGDMIFDFVTILNYLLRLQNLHAGDIIYTGTPEGVGPIRKGDSFRLSSPELGIDAQGLL